MLYKHTEVISLTIFTGVRKKLFVCSHDTGGKPRNYHEIVLSQATSGARRGSFQTENWIKKGWCHFHFCLILQLRTNNGEI